jgi:Tfp pilus assembly protein PilF
MDADLAVVNNPYIQEGLHWRTVVWAFTATTYYDYWHPLTWLTHAIDFTIFGRNAGGHLLMNLVYHMVTVVLLFTLLWRLTGARWRSVLVAALFAVHPIHVESVAWIVERKDVLSALFWFATMLAYVHYVNRPGRARYLGVVALFCLGLMAKPMAATLPFALLLLDYWPLRRYGAAANGVPLDCPLGTPRIRAWQTFLRLLREKVPLIGLAATASAFTLITCERYDRVAHWVPFSLRIANAVTSYVAYLGKLAWPANLAVLYPFPTSIPLWQSAAALIVLATMSLLILRARRSPHLLVGWLWFLGVLVPVIGLVPVGPQSMADRFVYIPAVGIYIAVVWSMADLARRWPRTGAYLASVSAAVVLLLVAGTIHQVRYWRDSVTLYRHTAEVTRDNYIIVENLGFALHDSGQDAKAIACLLGTLRVHPDRANAHYGLAEAYAGVGRLPEAIQQLATVLALEPEHAAAHHLLAQYLEQSGNDSSAAVHYREALRIKPGDWKVHNNLAMLRQKQGDVRSAELHFQRALQLNPDAAGVLHNYGILLINTGRPAQAVPLLQRAITLLPEPSATCDALGLAFARLGQLRQAEGSFSQAIGLAPHDTSPRLHRATLYLQVGALDAAIGDCRAAIGLAPGSGSAFLGLAQAFDRRAMPDSSRHYLEKAVQSGADTAGYAASLAADAHIRQRR